MPADSNIRIDGARILFRNFKGEESPFNKNKERSFAVLIDDKFAEDLTADEWNVKWLEPRQEGDERQAFLPVFVRYDVFPPRIVMVTETSRKVLEEEELLELDYANFLNVDMIIRPHNWNIEATGKHGVKAYVKTMYVTIEEDPLDAKYNLMFAERET